MTDDQPPQPTKKRVHSEKRKRTKATTHRWLQDEFNAVSEKARDAGLSFGAYVRAAALGDAGPRAQRRLPVVEENVLRVLALHGKYGNNMNQIAYQLNAHSDFAGAAQYEQGLVEWREIRDAMLELLNRVPEDPAAPPTGAMPATPSPDGNSNHPPGA
jgi:hypothetical protein